MGKSLTLVDHAGDHVFAEVVAGGGVGQILLQQLVQVAGIEDVDAHAGQRYGVAAWHGGRVFRLLDKFENLPIFIDGHHTKGRSLVARHFDATHRAAQAAGDMVLQHEGVVHAVDVIASQDHHVFRFAGPHDVDVLVDGIGRPAIPVLFAGALLCGQQIHHLIEFGAQKTPSALQVAQQRMGFVLRDHTDAADAGVHAVGEREIDDAELAAEIDRRLGAGVGQLFQARAPATSQDQCNGAANQHMGLHVAVGGQTWNVCFAVHFFVSSWGWGSEMERSGWAGRRFLGLFLLR